MHSRERERIRGSAVTRGYGKAHNAWRGAVIDRDHGQCRGCGIYPEKPHADHVIPLKHDGEQYALENGQTLCTSCHSYKTGTEQHDHQFGHRLRASGSKTGQSAPQGWRHMRI